MAIPKILGTGYSRAVAVNVKSHVEVKPPAIFVERVNVLEGERVTIRWKASPYFTSVKIDVANDETFAKIIKTVSASESEGSVVGIFKPGTYFLRASWDAESLIVPKG